MKSASQPSASRESLARDHWDVPIRVRLVPYVQFTCWLEGELEKLVRQWSGRAAPIATRGARRRAAIRKGPT